MKINNFEKFIINEKYSMINETPVSVRIDDEGFIIFYFPQGYVDENDPEKSKTKDFAKLVINSCGDKLNTNNVANNHTIRIKLDEPKLSQLILDYLIKSQPQPQPQPLKNQVQNDNIQENK